MDAAETLIVPRVERLPARYLAALALMVAAFAAASLWSALTPTTYRAETAIVVGVGNGPLRPGAPGSSTRLARSLDDLVASNLIAANVVTNLRLSTTPRALLRHVSVSTPEPGLLRVRVRDRDRVRAQAIAQEIGLVFERLVKLRFGSSKPPLRATVWDPSHAAGSSGAAWGRNLGLAAALAAAAFAVAWAAGRRRPMPAPIRVEVRDFKSQAPEPKRVISSTEPACESKPEPIEVRDVMSQVPPPEPEPEPFISAPEPEPAPARVPAGDGLWTLPRLERLVGRFGAEYAPEQVDEWRFYVLYLRDYADVDGRLPKSFDGLVLDTFGDLLDREHATAGAAR